MYSMYFALDVITWKKRKLENSREELQKIEKKIGLANGHIDFEIM